MSENHLHAAKEAADELLTRLSIAAREVSRHYQLPYRALLDTVLLALLVTRLDSAEKYDATIVTQ